MLYFPISQYLKIHTCELLYDKNIYIFSPGHLTIDYTPPPKKNPKLFKYILIIYNVNEYKSKTFCTYIENIKLATEKPRLQLVKDYQIEFAVSTVQFHTLKKLFSQQVKIFEVTGIHLEFIAFRNQASIFSMSETPSKISIN